MGWKLGVTFIFLTMLSVSTVCAQLFKAEEGLVSFFSKAPLENIAAQNKAVASLIHTGTRKIAVSIPIRQFDFPNDLMEEHFNENYLESEKYPKATFSGVINETIDFSRPGSYAVSATGKFSIHGVETDRTLKGTLTIKDNTTFELVSDFEVKLADHNITIPTIMFNKIAEVVQVRARFVYKPKS